MIRDLEGWRALGKHSSLQVSGFRDHPNPKPDGWCQGSESSTEVRVRVTSVMKLCASEGMGTRKCTSRGTRRGTSTRGLAIHEMW